VRDQLEGKKSSNEGEDYEEAKASKTVEDYVHIPFLSVMGVG
jgi:hypothetical protein